MQQKHGRPQKFLYFGISLNKFQHKRTPPPNNGENDPQKKEMKGLPHGEKGPSKEEKNTLHKKKFPRGGGVEPPPWVAAMLAFPQEKFSHNTTGII